MARAGLARVGRGLGSRSLVAGSALALAGAVASRGGSACGKAVGPFSVSGTWVLRADGEPFISYGLTVPGLQSPYWGGSVTLDRAKIAPTTMNGKTWTCESNRETQPGQGAGSQVLAWFRKQNG